MKYILYIIFTLIILSCKNNIIGVYQNTNPNMIFSKKVGYIMGTTLLLNSDSTFIDTSCGNIITGNWKVVNDTLFLICKSNRYRIDSLNTLGFNGKFANCQTSVQYFIIKKNKLIYTFWRGKTKYMNLLIKNIK